MATVHDELLTRAHVQHRARIERIVARRSGDPEVAADVVSEAFLRLYRRMVDGWVPDDVPAWLTRVALNLAISDTRHGQVVRRSAERMPVAAAAGPPDDVVIGREALRRVADALAGMSAAERSLVLAAAGGASSSRLGAERGCSVAGARIRLCRARRRLRLAVGDVV